MKLKRSEAQCSEVKDLYDGTAEAYTKQHTDPSLRRRRALLLIQDDKGWKKLNSDKNVEECDATDV